VETAACTKARAVLFSLMLVECIAVVGLHKSRRLAFRPLHVL
jgi:hypothetical protein